MCIHFWKGGRIHFNLLTLFLSDMFLSTFFHYQIKLFIEENNLLHGKHLIFKASGFNQGISLGLRTPKKEDRPWKPEGKRGIVKKQYCLWSPFERWETEAQNKVPCMSCHGNSLGKKRILWSETT